MSKPLYQVIRDDVEGRIRRGEWTEGARLPTEKEFAERHGCSRGTVVKALSKLVDDGWITKRRSAGTFVAGNSAPTRVRDVTVELTEAGSEALRHPLRRSIVMALRSKELTTKQLSEEFEVPVGRLYHHLRVLLDAELIRVSRERRLRGATERSFRAAVTGGYIIRQPAEEQRAFLQGVLNLSGDHLRERFDAARLEAADDDVYVAGTVTVHASDDALRELTTLMGDWIRRHLEPRPGVRGTNLGIVTFPMLEEPGVAD